MDHRGDHCPARQALIVKLGDIEIKEHKAGDESIKRRRSGEERGIRHFGFRSLGGAMKRKNALAMASLVNDGTNGTWMIDSYDDKKDSCILLKGTQRKTCRLPSCHG